MDIWGAAAVILIMARNLYNDLSRALRAWSNRQSTRGTGQDVKSRRAMDIDPSRRVGRAVIYRKVHIVQPPVVSEAPRWTALLQRLGRGLGRG